MPKEENDLNIQGGCEGAKYSGLHLSCTEHDPQLRGKRLPWIPVNALLIGRKGLFLSVPLSASSLFSSSLLPPSPVN